ncbi:MAG: NAD(P)H-hydrate dehydratase [Deltaproteobacteria bacterium]|nr:NAD(P)H-hydrate dehydratase [Deltaproteobacteria bacterium]
MRIVSNEEMRKLDEAAIRDLGVPGIVLMENAGIEAGRRISEACVKKNYSGEILVFCGKGKNGGDGLVVARRLLASGHRVRIFLLQPAADYAGEAGIHLKVLKNTKAKISAVESATVLKEYFASAVPPFFVVDAILGTGLVRDIEGLFYDVIELINHNATEIFSLDIPSGVAGDTGRIAGTAIMASTTLSFGYPRLGHFLSPGAARRGQLCNVDLTFPREWGSQGDKFLLTRKNVAPLLQQRDRFGHKNSFGHSLLIGGSPGRLGAIEMASQSALKMGTGLVTVASWEDSFPSLEVKLSSEIMNIRITREGDRFKIQKPGLAMFNSVVVGPGLGLRPEGAQLLKELLMSYAGPVVIDADGLNLLADNKFHDLLSGRSAPTVLTPHPGEMARLLGKSKDAVTDDPVGSVREAVERTGAVVLLKGATTLIHSSEGITWLNHYPNDGMATAGSGDVLAGVIGGLLGQRMSAIEATQLGVYLHSLSGRFAAEQCGHRSMTALDIIGNIREAFRDLREYRASRVSPACEEIL